MYIRKPKNKGKGFYTKKKERYKVQNCKAKREVLSVFVIILIIMIGSNQLVESAVIKNIKYT